MTKVGKKAIQEQKDKKLYIYNISDILEVLKTTKYPSGDFATDLEAEYIVIGYVNERAREFAINIAKDLISHNIPYGLITASTGLETETLEELNTNLVE